MDYPQMPKLIDKENLRNQFEIKARFANKFDEPHSRNQQTYKPHRQNFQYHT